ncbi:olfactory receptor 1500-like [Salarias fasciatus]|uniref:olfactory receptor 1500-like n=1 Tax=Salarias fasciatus TaxID=181472 RepID=UPI0011765E27|nr:olfactory receptor 1500-like [Salarias fasciatus]
MTSNNITNIKYFVITGFPGLQPQYYGPISVLLLLVFLAIMIGNGLILATITFVQTLHKPTYLIFCNLAMTDLAFGTVTLPRVIARYWWNDVMSSYIACFTQMYFVHALGAIHSLILLMMALDRFVAVWFPFQYLVLFTNKSVSISCALCWILTLIRMGGIVFNASTLPYCDVNVIMQCYCDHISITRLACGNRLAFIKEVAIANAMVTLMFPLSFIIFSYFSIFIAVLRISQVERRHKVLSTCAPQLFITGLYYVPRSFVYIANNVGFHFSLLARVVITMMYSLIPAAVNPLIYCFKTADIKQALIQRVKNAKIGITG